jgi:hypothetical protein
MQPARYTTPIIREIKGLNALSITNVNVDKAMKFCLFITALILTGFSGPTAVHADVLLLSCSGIGSQIAPSVSFGSAYSSSAGSVTGTSTNYGVRESPDLTIVEIRDGVGRIRVPATIIPPIHTGGTGGWWALSDILMGEDEISAKFSLNFMDKPKVVIDRRTGQISINGFGQWDFRGSCEAVDTSVAARKF